MALFVLTTFLDFFSPERKNVRNEFPGGTPPSRAGAWGPSVPATYETCAPGRLATELRAAEKIR